MYDFKFSVVMAVYNTEKYLEKSIDSIINQTIGFEENIQIIFVNDGSTDSSSDVISTYQSIFPDNIKLIHQENQGQAVARNNGLNYVRGKYVNFLDSDDYLSETTMEDVFRFFESNYDEIDVVSIPIIQFGRTEGEHILNYKFKESQVIDLEINPNNPQLHISSSFIKFDSINGVLFPENIVGSEDSNFINKILLQKKKLGVINSANYFYRKREDFTSTLDNGPNNLLYYNNRLKYHFLDIINYSIDICGDVPKFIQYTLIYDLYWLVNNANLNIFKDSNLRNDFLNSFYNVIKFIDEDVIWNNGNLKYNDLKKFLFYARVNDCHVIPSNGVLLMVGDKQIDKLDYHSFWIDSITVENNFVVINGFLNSLFDSKFISVSAIYESENRSERIIAEHIEEGTKNVVFLSVNWQFNYKFRLRIPLNELENSKFRISVNYHIDGDSSNYDTNNLISYYLKVGFKNSSIITKNCNYFVSNSFLIAFENKIFYIMSQYFEGIIKIN